MSEEAAEQKTILIADDDPDIRELVATALEAGGFLVEQAQDGASAVKAIQDVKPDLVILDVTMPGMTGHEVLDKLKHNLVTREIPVVFLTADGDQQSRLEGLKGGAVDYFDKPFDATMLRRRIERILWKKANEDAG